MKKERILIPLACFSLIFSGLAEAQSSSRLRSAPNSPRIDIGSRVSAGANLGRATSSGSSFRRPSTASRPSVRPSPRANINLNRGRDSGAARNPLGGGLRSENPFGDLLGQYLNHGYGRGQHYDPHAGEKAHAEAYRDAAIANAIVNVVGILATANQPRVEPAYPPDAVTVAPSGPRGHVERQRVLVQEARVEEYKVWIPEHRIPETGEIVEGHHETRRREIPAVYEEREVWIPAR